MTANAVLCDTYVPFATGPGSTVQEPQWTTMFRRLAQTGVVNGLGGSMAVTAGAGLHVVIASGGCWIEGHFGQMLNPTTLALAVADAVNPRIDLALARIDWTAKTIAVDITTGDASGAPAAPALVRTGPPGGIWEIGLASIAVAAGAGTLATGAIVDQRSLVTINSGLNAMGVVPIMGTAARNALVGLPNGARVFDSDLNQDYTWKVTAGVGMWQAAAAAGSTSGSLIYLAANFR